MQPHRHILATIITAAALLALVQPRAFSQNAAPPAGEAPQQEVMRRLFDLKAGLEKSQAQLDAAAKQATATLNANYTAALDRAIAAATKAGKLDEILKLRGDRDAVAAGKPIPADDDNDTPASLKALRDAYRKAAVKNADDARRRSQPVYAAYDRALADYQTALTKQGRIEDATRVKVARETAAAKTGAELPAEEEKPAIKGDVQPGMSFAAMQKKGGVLKGVGFVRGDEHTPIDLSVAKPYNDFVAIHLSASKGWIALRANGEAVGARVENKKWLPFHERGVKAISLSADCAFLTRNGELKEIGTAGKKAAGNNISRRFFFPLGVDDAHMAFDRSGALAYFKSGPENKPPPKDLFQGAVAFTGMYHRQAVGLFSDRPPVSWDDGTGQSYTFPAEFKGCIQGDGKANNLVLRNLRGNVFTAGATTLKLDGDFAPPATLPPAIRVRAGIEWCAAQAADGTWQAWGKPGDAEKKIKDIGVAIDLDGSEADLNRGCLLWIEPEKRP